MREALSAQAPIGAFVAVVDDGFPGVCETVAGLQHSDREFNVLLPEEGFVKTAHGVQNFSSRGCAGRVYVGGLVVRDGLLIVVNDLAKFLDPVAGALCQDGPTADTGLRILKRSGEMQQPVGIRLAVGVDKRENRKACLAYAEIPRCRRATLRLVQNLNPAGKGLQDLARPSVEPLSTKSSSYPASYSRLKSHSIPGPRDRRALYTGTTTLTFGRCHSLVKRAFRYKSLARDTTKTAQRVLPRPSILRCASTVRRIAKFPVFEILKASTKRFCIGFSSTGVPC